MFRKLFKKKEKPIKEYNVFDIGHKAIYTKGYGYIPTRIAYYEDRIEFCFNRYGEDGNEVVFTPSAIRTDDRLLPFEIDGVTFCWDTVDMAIRRKCQPEGEAEDLIPSVHFYPNEVMTMDKEFAERELSPLALSYATFDGEKYVWYYPDGSATPAVFEIPRLFLVFNEVDRHPLSADFLSVNNNLMTFTPSYIETAGLESEKIMRIYEEHLERGK